MLYYMILYSTRLDYMILYFISLYDTILYYILNFVIS